MGGVVYFLTDIIKKPPQEENIYQETATASTIKKTFKSDQIEFQYPSNYSIKSSKKSGEFSTIIVSNGSIDFVISNTPFSYGAIEEKPINFFPDETIVTDSGTTTLNYTYFPEWENYAMLGSRGFFYVSAFPLTQSQISSVDARIVFRNIVTSLKP